MLMERIAMVGTIALVDRRTCMHCYLSNFSTVFTSANVSCADNGGCSDSCAVIDGVEQCFCPTGFVLNRFDEQTCVGKV